MSDTQSGKAPRVGITFTRATVSNPWHPDRPPLERDFLVDSGAIYSVLPTSDLEALAVERIERQEFRLADGTHQAYDVGEVFFALPSRRGTSPVVFGPEGVTPLLGVLTLERLGLMLNPVTRELLPMRLFLAALRRSRKEQPEPARARDVAEVPVARHQRHVVIDAALRDQRIG